LRKDRHAQQRDNRQKCDSYAHKLPMHDFPLLEMKPFPNMKSTLNVEFSETGSLPQTIRFNRKGLGCITVPIQETESIFLIKRSRRTSSEREGSGQFSYWQGG
jgi:hypothetical protein